MPAIGKFTITLTDTLEPLNTILYDQNGNPYDLTSPTVSAYIETSSGTVELAATTTGITKQPTQTFTVDTDTDHIKANSHGVKNGDKIVVASTTTLPTGLSASTNYFATECTKDRFKLEAYEGAGAINITGAGSGTHTFYIVGSLQFDFASANVDTAGFYRLWFIRSSGGETNYHPGGGDYYDIEIVAVGN